MEQSRLILRLTMLRKAIRRRLLAYGVCAVVAGGILAFLAIVALDWMLWFPPTLRLVVGGVFVVGFILAALHWIIQPMKVPLGVADIAARLEAHFGTLHDRLSSTVNFLQRSHETEPDIGSENMMQQVVVNTEEMIAGFPLESALSLRPLALRGGVLAAGVLFIAAILWAVPDWPRTGLYRYIHPWGEIEWPRTVGILPLTGDQMVAMSESATVRMRIQRGLTPSLRGVVHIRESDGETVALAMQRDESGGTGDTYYAVIDAVADDLTYWFEAGDASTDDRPFQLRVVRRPQVAEALATVEPPPYTQATAQRIHDLNDGPVHATIGGHITITLRTTKPLPLDGDNLRQGFRTDAGEWIPLSVHQDDRHELFTRIPIEKDLRFRIELIDEDGFENRGAPEYAIVATPDVPPTVTVIEPQGLEELTPKGSVRSVIHVRDDFGISDLHLLVERPGQPGSHTLPLIDYLEAPRASSIDYAGIIGVEASAHHVWRLEEALPEPLSPGDVVIYRAVARDNRVGIDGTGQAGRSTPMRIRIISENEFDIRLRTDLATLQARIRQTTLDQADLLDASLALRRSGDNATPLADEQRRMTASLSAQQARLARRLRDLAGRFRRIIERMARNQSGDDTARARIASLGLRLQEIAAQPMTDASTALNRAGAREDAAAQQLALGETLESQENALQHLQEVLRDMSLWGSFRELITKTRDLLDRQRTVRRNTIATGKSMLGKPIETLTEAEASALKRIHRRQEQLLADVEQLLIGMKRRAESARQEDTAAAEAIDAALRAARAHEAVGHIRDATGHLAANRTAAAGIAQQAAATALSQMVAALRERETHQLEELRKHLARAEQQVSDLIEQQKSLRAATYEAGLMAVEDAGLSPYAQQQRRLKRNAEHLGDELADVVRANSLPAGTEPAGRIIRQAAVPMGVAEGHLRKADAPAATIAQDEALGLLRDALERLEELAQQADDEVLRRSLEQIRLHLEATLAAQLSVNKGIGALRERIETRGRIARKEARQASKLARRQADARAMLDVESRDFERVVVYRWALKRVGTWMDESRKRLSARDIDTMLVSTTDRIVNELRQLLQAIVDTESLPVDSSFVESDSNGGGGQGQSGEQRAVPTVAELLLLKAVQGSINDRTTELHKRLDAADLTERQLQELKTIGEDQAEVRRLTEMVTKRLTSP